MRRADTKDAAARKDACDIALAASHVRIKNAGGQNSRFVLYAVYAPARGVRKRIFSNNVRFGKSWPTKEEITESDKEEFVRWISCGLARGGGGQNHREAKDGPVARSSARVDGMVRQSTVPISSVSPSTEIEYGVLQCVQKLVQKIVDQSRFLQCGNPQAACRKRVAPKQRPHCRVHITAPASFEASSRRFRSFVAKHFSSKRLTHRRSHGYHYRKERLRRAAAVKAEEDVEWLRRHENRLATVIARQDLHELLPEGNVPVSCVHELF